MRLALLTPTGDRPLAFSFCERWMSRQTDQDWEWIVVDDGTVPVRATMGQTVIRRHRLATDSPHTLPENLRAALPHIEAFDAVLIIEDDDHYGRHYVATMREWLYGADMVGEAGAKYYHLQYGYRRLDHHTHVSLCRTGFRSCVVNRLMGSVDECIASRHPGVDRVLWATYSGRTRIERDPDGVSRLSVAIKGMPGRQNTIRKPITWTPDPTWRQLRYWAGDEDAQVYIDLMMGTEAAA